ncbi:dual specificity protein phosphatase 4 [Geospiza fortis]|uniref:Dual specificity protein phosphatase 4 n=1 Tax=Geospiza fortis TaxID=48883 RepID=A0A6I9ZCX1_GEOFO|nr:dual specificity protein phosphatase 4 [Geospiza fortis]
MLSGSSPGPKIVQPEERLQEETKTTKECRLQKEKLTRDIQEDGARLFSVVQVDKRQKVMHRISTETAAISPERGCPCGLSRLRGIERAPWPCPGPEGRGYERFSSEYPEFCAKTKSLSNVSPPTSAEPLDLGCSSCGTPFHDQGGPVEILPFLYLGSAYHAARRDMLDALGITALLNVSSDCHNHFEGHYQYKCIPVEDNHKADISSWFMEAIEFIDSVKECCGRVLVHCQAGISRSATICLAYLMMKKRVKLEEAFEFVKQRRSIISPNFSFMGQLLQFESQVLATSYAVEAVSPSGTLRERGKATSTPTSQFVFSFPVSVGVHATPSSLPYLHSPITTSPSC